MTDHDEITLHVNGLVFSQWLNYTVSSNLYDADSKFEFSIARSDVEIPSGSECVLRINKIPALTGIVDLVNVSYDKNGVSAIIEGRDIMGMLVDQYVTRWRTFAGKTLRYLAETLLQDVPIVSKKEIVFLDNTEKLNVTGDMVQPEPGQTVFEVLKAAASARGVLFYADAGGRFVFSKPLKNAEALYDFSVVKSGVKTVNNSAIIKGSLESNSTQHYQTLIVTGEEEEQSFKRTFTDSTAPINKTLVVVRNDSSALNDFGNNLITQQRFRATNINYTVSGHSQAGEVFKTNRIATVDDTVLGVKGQYLLYGVTYKLDKTSGIFTDIRLGLPGLIA